MGPDYYGPLQIDQIDHELDHLDLSLSLLDAVQDQDLYRTDPTHTNSSQLAALRGPAPKKSGYSS